MDNANTTTTQHDDSLVDELLQYYKENEQCLTEIIEAFENLPDLIYQLNVAEWKTERDEIRTAIVDREFRKMITNDWPAYFQRKIDLADSIIQCYKSQKIALTALIEEYRHSTDKHDRLEVSRYKIERFKTDGAIATQEFNKKELMEKYEGYKNKIDGYKEIIDKEWNTTLVKIKEKLVKCKKTGADPEPYRRALDRADQPFETIEEKVEYFIGIENMAR